MSANIIDWVCYDCGVNYGKWYQGGTYRGPAQWMATHHIGTCELCGAKDVSVTEARDYGGLIPAVKYKDKSRRKRKVDANS